MKAARYLNVFERYLYYTLYKTFSLSGDWPVAQKAGCCQVPRCKLSHEATDLQTTRCVWTPQTLQDTVPAEGHFCWSFGQQLDQLVGDSEGPPEILPGLDRR